MSSRSEIIIKPGDPLKQGQLPWEGRTACVNQARKLAQKRANKLNGAQWLRYSISVWSDIRKSPEEVALKHPALFPASLVTRLIQCFTTDDDNVIFDPFAGVGSTAVAAHRLGKAGIGIEIEPRFAGKANARLGTVFDITGNMVHDTGSKVYCDDARNMLNFVSEASVDMVITSPPYWNVLLQRRTADYKETRHYGNERADLGKIADYGDFLVELEEVFSDVFRTLKAGKYCCVVVMDLRKADKFFPYHSDVAVFMQRIGFQYDDIIIWDRRAEYSNFRPLGYPSRFRVNKAHEYILIFRKPAEVRKKNA